MTSGTGVDDRMDDRVDDHTAEAHHEPHHEPHHGQGGAPDAVHDGTPDPTHDSGDDGAHDPGHAPGPDPSPSAAHLTTPGAARHTSERRAVAYWLTEPGRGELRAVILPEPGPGDVVVRALYSGISRGTESLVHRGGVPADQYAAMRAPFQTGDFPGPLQYGYLSVGVVEEGPADLRGRTAFCLFPHQDRYVVPATALSLVPDDVPPRRAVLAGTVETALNALWDATPLIGDRVTVIGAGMVGCSVARLLARIPATDVTLVDLDPARAATAAALGVRFAHPDDADGDRDLVVHASASAAGLQRSLDLLAPEGTVLELSWYGDRPVEVTLGGAFHSRRLSIRASQVGVVSPRQGGRRNHAERLAVALDLLRDPAFDTLLTGCSPFDELPSVMSGIAAGELPGLCHTIDYGHSTDDHRPTDSHRTTGDNRPTDEE